MKGKPTIFSKVMILIVLLVTPVLILYIYTNKVSVNVVQDEIQSSSLTQLSFFLQQFDTTVEQLAMFPGILGSDPYLRDFVEHRSNKPYDRISEQTRIMEKLSLQSVSSAWTNDLTVYLPKEATAVSSNHLITYNKEDVTTYAPLRGWIYDPTTRVEARQPGARFIRGIVEPYGATSLSQIKSMIQVSFSVNNVTAMLDQVKSGGKGDPFFYRFGQPPIKGSDSDSEMLSGLISVLDSQRLGEKGSLVTQLGGKQYAIFYVLSKQLNWFLVDYVPVENILAPIKKTNQLFYTTIAMLLLMSILAAYFLYRNVQRPIRKLVQGVQRLKKGELSARLHYQPHNEFDFLFERFNEMAEQIQDLVEHVYAEKLRLHEAKLKQLQAQINPHFLYNSLFFVINTAKLGDTRAVVAMSQNLAEYYRYTTRMEVQNATLREEIKLLENYLMIHNLRMQRLQYVIDIPESMLDVQIPRLLLQPLVENAIVHGIENKSGDGMIHITGKQQDHFYMVIIEDNGVGISLQVLGELKKQLLHPTDTEVSCGVWNVHQRLQYSFGEGSGLDIVSSKLGGLKVTLTWRRNEANDATHDCG
ncbi:sensor histidine kinase [Paenibacillus sp. N3.4]|uniref:sensor histidine kinase n=1 Tax=Paenibacillus sp. N3.4 TaxID=2603222 RepID=UPI0011C9994C|nr:sensor histidine kinase [Paenibacillus sp. N3.4]TXK83640.1 sensor histidine kinase [Paenibacillus sp. N3.4]